MDHRGIPSHHQMRDIFNDEATAMQHLFANDVCDCPTTCGNCGMDVNCKHNPSRKCTVRCGGRVCQADNGRRWQQNLLAGTFFMHARLPVNEILHFLWLFVVGTTDQVAQSTFGWSSATAADWMIYAQQLVGEIVLEFEENCQLGGPGVRVQMDESKFGKRKCHRGHKVEGVWVFGGAEETDERKCFLIKVPDRKRRTLFPSIRRFILPGSIVISDGFSVHCDVDSEHSHIKDIPDMCYDHAVVIHDKECKNADGDHTNDIEGTWSGVKLMTPKRMRTWDRVQGCLHEFMWRRQNAGRLWEALLEALRVVRH